MGPRGACDRIPQHSQPRSLVSTTAIDAAMRRRFVLVRQRCQANRPSRRSLTCAAHASTTRASGAGSGCTLHASASVPAAPTLCVCARVWGLGFRVSGSGLWAQGLGLVPSAPTHCCVCMDRSTSTRGQSTRRARRWIDGERDGARGRYQCPHRRAYSHTPCVPGTNTQPRQPHPQSVPPTEHVYRRR